MSHEHFDVDLDKRWVCYVTRCLIPEVAPMPPQPEAPKVTLEVRPLCAVCQGYVDARVAP